MRFLSRAFFLLMLVLAMYASAQADLVALLEPIMGSGVTGGFVFVLTQMLAVVLAPLAALPLVPLAAALFGPFATGVYAVIGWTAGGVLAFLVARYAGRPLLMRVVSLDELARYERLVPREMEFVTLVLLRMIIPVDVLSYAVGFLSTISLRSYALATLIGVTPFSFIFAYGSSAAATGQYVLIGALAALGVSIFVSVYLILRRVRRRIPDSE